MSREFIRLCEQLTELRESGPFFVGCCPFCGEKNWMWVVNAVKDHAYCFACKRHCTRREIWLAVEARESA